MKNLRVRLDQLPAGRGEGYFFDSEEPKFARIRMSR